MPGHSTEILLPARFSALPEALVRLRAAATRAGADERLLHHLELVVEELVSNTIHHGFGSECDHLIRLELSPTESALHLTYADSARPFATTDCPVLAKDHIGGHGLSLIHALTAHFSYRRAGEWNISELSFPLPA